MKEYIVPSDHDPSTQPPVSKEKGGIGLFQLLGFGLLLLFVAVLLAVIVRSLFISA
jgi:hypothetical protein